MTSFSQDIHFDLNLFYLLNLYEIFNGSGFLKHNHDGLIKRPYQVQEIMFLLLILEVELVFLTRYDGLDAVVDMEIYLFSDVL